MRPAQAKKPPAGENAAEHEAYARAMLNLLDDFSTEKGRMEEGQRAVLNILEDFAGKKGRSDDTQRAMLNILDDFEAEKGRMEETQRAVLNILEDFAEEKARSEDTQRAMQNILEDFGVQREKAEEANRELREAFDSLHRAKDAADAAVKELEAFSYSVSHDLRAPLRHIQGFVEMLKEGAGPVLGDENRRHLEIISASASKMGSLIDDLLAFSRMGRAEMGSARIELGGMVEDVIRELGDEADGRNVTWKLGPLPVVHGDPAMIKLVLVNLVANALKFTRKTEAPVIEISSFAGGDGEQVIFVRDNGVGFDMRYADKLFGVFQRLHRAHEFEGTGIGLANVRRIINRHGGGTWAEGAVGKGAMFYFSLPGQFEKREEEAA